MVFVSSLKQKSQTIHASRLCVLTSTVHKQCVVSFSALPSISAVKVSTTQPRSLFTLKHFGHDAVQFCVLGEGG